MVSYPLSLSLYLPSSLSPSLSSLSLSLLAFPLLSFTFSVLKKQITHHRYDKIHQIFLNFINMTGLSMVATDGPYGGSSCASTNHDQHTGLEDSIYWQNRLQGTFYKDLKELNIFISQPDWYFHQGGNKAPMGYNENQYSLPRWEDLAISRQGMYDDTYHFIPSMGWMFLPLVQYHSGGAAAEFEPLSKHLPEYEWALAQYMGYGVAVVYRGPRLYDTSETKALVHKWVSFYNKYRDILTSDIVHVRRPDMQGELCVNVQYLSVNSISIPFPSLLFLTISSLPSSLPPSLHPLFLTQMWTP